MPQVSMPRLSDSMEEGTIVKWLVGDGDEVAVGDPLVEIETDKASMVFEADAAGVVHHVARVGDTVPLGMVIAEIRGLADQRTGGARQGVAARAAAPATRPRSNERIKASPLARRTAEQQGVELAGITGSGPTGRITRADLQAALASGSASEGTPSAPPGKAESAKGQTEIAELTRLQQTVSRRMSESKATVPHFYLQAEIDMSRAHEAHGSMNTGSDGVHPSLNDMVVKACALALREFPRANGAYRDGCLELYSRVNVGIAVAASEALVVPTIFDADRKGLRHIAAESRALVRRAREGDISPPELSGATFTVSNLGMYGVSNFHAVVNPPQAAILAVGQIVQRAVVRRGELAAARLMGVTLACDHRILYGAQGAEFLARVKSLLEEPLGLAL